MEENQMEIGQRVSDVIKITDENDFRRQYSPSQVKIFELEATVKNK